MARSFFRYNSADALPMLCGVGIVALIFTTFLGYNQLAWWFLVPAFFAIAWSYCWNLQCISHNFIHNPFFTNEWLNRAYGVLETFALGVPHILYHHYHLNHHYGDNDAKGPDGTTKDWSSIYRYGTDGKPESFWRYVLLSFWRIETTAVLQVAARHKHIPQLVAESIALVGFWGAMIWVDWRYFVYFYLPSYYLGWSLSFAEGYLEHYDAKPGNYYANSVSSYNWLYNLLWFNNGFHQEHHWDPKRHWTRMQQLHGEIREKMAANETKVLYGPHITGLIEDWVVGGRQTLEAPRLAKNSRVRAA